MCLVIARHIRGEQMPGNIGQMLKISPQTISGFSELGELNLYLNLG